MISCISLVFLSCLIISIIIYGGEGSRYDLISQRGEYHSAKFDFLWSGNELGVDFGACFREDRTG